jgi:hypothetical protein
MNKPNETEIPKPERPFWLSVLRWMVWLAMLTLVIAFASRNPGGGFIYQKF